MKCTVCHDLEVMSLNPGRVKLGVHSTSVLKPLSQLAHDHFKTLRSCFLAFARWLANVARAVASVACDFPLACSRVCFLNMFEIQRRLCATLSIALGLTIVSTSIVQRCVYSQEWCTNFWGRKMIRILRCECCATIRMLLDVWYVILQRCTTFARLLGTLPTSIPCISTELSLKSNECCSKWCGCEGQRGKINLILPFFMPILDQLSVH